MVVEKKRKTKRERKRERQEKRRKIQNETSNGVRHFVVHENLVSATNYCNGNEDESSDKDTDDCNTGTRKCISDIRLRQQCIVPFTRHYCYISSMTA